MLNLFNLQISNVAVIILFSVILSCFIIFLSFLLSPSVPDSEKFSIYECGFDPYEDSRNEFNVKFYLVAILFIIFDLETVFFFPWCVSLSFLNTTAFWSMGDFIVELMFGYIYAWRIGALNWN